MGCEGCARAILLVFNLIIFLIGAATLGVGIWVVIDGSIFFDLLKNIPDATMYNKLIGDAAYVLIGAGAAMFLIAFLGCCGAWKKHKCLLVTYAIIISVILLLELASVILAYFFYDKVVVIINDHLATALSSTYNTNFIHKSGGEYTYDTGNVFSRAVDTIQIEFTCCGITNHTNYLDGTYPVTCCPSAATGAELTTQLDTLWQGNLKTYTTSVPECANNGTYIADNVKPCVDSISNYVKSKSVIFMAIGGATLGVQLLLVILACCLFCAVRSEEGKA